MEWKSRLPLPLPLNERKRKLSKEEELVKEELVSDPEETATTSTSLLFGRGRSLHPRRKWPVNQKRLQT